MVKKLPKRLFLNTLKYVPRVAVDIIPKNAKREIALAQRNIPPLRGSWHMFGSFILKGESINACAKRIIKEEFGLSMRRPKLKLLGAFDDLGGDPRGHVVDIVYELRLNRRDALRPTRETKNIGFFKRLPKKIGFNHRETLGKLGYR